MTSSSSSSTTMLLLVLTALSNVALADVSSSIKGEEPMNEHDLKLMAQAWKDSGILGATPVLPTSSTSRKEHNLRHLKKKKKGKSYYGDSDSDDDGECPKGSKDLDTFPQWKQEVGYWIGEYTLLQGDGTPNESADWPYPYGQYTGFITGNVVGNSYRQRNVFLYPPQTTEKCEDYAYTSALVDVVGNGTCGENGNSLVFAADQTGCSKDGSIEGAVGPFSTKTTLVGADNALLYQVFFGDAIFQSQLTTLHAQGTKRTRTAQSFTFTEDFSGTSYYRERKVSRSVFYDTLAKTVEDYNILESDLCLRDGFALRQPVPGYEPGFEQCKEHLELSFEL